MDLIYRINRFDSFGVYTVILSVRDDKFLLIAIASYTLMFSCKNTAPYFDVGEGRHFLLVPLAVLVTEGTDSR